MVDFFHGNRACNASVNFVDVTLVGERRGQDLLAHRAREGLDVLVHVDVLLQLLHVPRHIVRTQVTFDFVSVRGFY